MDLSVVSIVPFDFGAKEGCAALNGLGLVPNFYTLFDNE